MATRRRRSPNRAALTPEKLDYDRLRQRISEMWRSGQTMGEIGQALSLSRQAVGHHIHVLRRQAIEAGTLNLKEFLAVKLHELEQLRLEAVEAYEQSCQPVVEEIHEDVIDKAGQVKTLVKKRLRPQHGDPRFLDQAQRAIERQSVLLGLWSKGPDIRVGVQVNASTQSRVDPRLEIAQILRQQIERLKKGEALLAGIRAAEVAEAGATLQAGQGAPGGQIEERRAGEEGEAAGGTVEPES